MRLYLQKEAGALSVECCGYATELFTYSAGITVLREEGFSKRIKVLSWCSMKTVFGWTVSYIGHNKQSIHVIFGALYLAEPGLTAGVRCQTKFGKSRVSKKLAQTQTILLYALFYQGALSLQLY